MARCATLHLLTQRSEMLLTIYRQMNGRSLRFWSASSSLTLVNCENILFNRTLQTSNCSRAAIYVFPLTGATSQKLVGPAKAQLTKNPTSLYCTHSFSQIQCAYHCIRRKQVYVTRDCDLRPPMECSSLPVVGKGHKTGGKDFADYFSSGSR